MSATIDVVQSGTGADSVSSFSYTHTASGTPTGMGIGFAGYTDGGRSPAVTVGGTSATKKVEAVGAPTSSGRSPTIFGIGSSAQALTGARSVVMTNSGGGNLYGIPYSVTVLGGDTSTVFSASNNNWDGGPGSTTPTVTCATAAGEILMDAMVSGYVSGFTGVFIGADQTLAASFFSTLIGTSQRGSTQDGANGGVMSWTLPLTTGWDIAAASFKAGTGGGGGRGLFLPPKLSGLGSGGSFFGDRLA